MRRAALLLVLPFAACGRPDDGDPAGFVTEAYTTECPPATVEGVDVYDGQGNIDWAQVKAAGRQFAIMKATQGDYNHQATFAANWKNARAAGVLRSPYHFFDPSKDGVTQANLFLADLEQAGGLLPGDLPPMLDIECPVSSNQTTANAQDNVGCEYCTSKVNGHCVAGDSGWAPPATMYQRMWDWIHTVEAATGRKPMLYSYPAWFADVGFTDKNLAQYPLFIATLGNCAAVPAPWTSAVVWQYSWTGTVAGIPKQVDLDRFMGTLADLQAFADGPRPLRQVNGNEALSVVGWLDGHVELFGVSPTGQLLHAWTTAANDTWNLPAPLDGDAKCGFASSYWGPPWSYPEVWSPLSTGNAGHLWWANGKWNTFQDYGGAGLGLRHFSTLVRGDGRTEVFALGGDGAIWHDLWDTTKKDWGGWQSLGGSFVTGASTMQWKDHQEIFATDGAGAVWHDYTTTDWTGWTKIDGPPMASRPVPARWPDDHGELFARGADGRLYHSAAPGNDMPFPAFTAVSTATMQGEPSVIVNQGNGASTGTEVFARDGAGKVVHLWWTGSAYNDFQPLGDQASASDPFAWIRGDGLAEVFAIDASGTLTRAIHDNGWQPWTPIGGGFSPCAEAPAAPDAGADLAPSPTGDAGGGVDAKGGCSCAIGERSHAPAPLLAIALLLAISLRRRR